MIQFKKLRIYCFYTEIAFNGAAKIENEHQKYLDYHLILNNFLVYFNPIFHIPTMVEHPCAPNFISSIFLHCENMYDNRAALKDRLWFLLHDYYIVAKWQHATSFMWCCVVMATDIVIMELRKLAEKR